MTILAAKQYSVLLQQLATDFWLSSILTIQHPPIMAFRRDGKNLYDSEIRIHPPTSRNQWARSTWVQACKKSVVITEKIFKLLCEQPAQLSFVNQNKRNNKRRNQQGIETRDYWCIKISVASAVWLSRPQAAQHRRRALLKNWEISVCQSCSQPVIQTSVLSSENINRIKCSIGRDNYSQ